MKVAASWAGSWCGYRKSFDRVNKTDAQAHIAAYVVMNELNLPEQEGYYRPALRLNVGMGFVLLVKLLLKI